MVLALLAAPAARADFKAFAHVYPYFTQPEGGKEVEIWNGIETGDLSHPGTTTLLDERAEIEYGLTDHWDLSFYWVFHQAPEAPIALDSYQLETRYRFAEKGLWPVDTELYAEVERPTDLSQPFELETKLILEKDVHRFLFQGNLIDEEKLVGGAVFGYRLAFNGGAGYEVRPGLRFGVELLANHELPFAAPGALPEDTLHVGPSIALATSRFWFVLTPAFRVLGHDDLEDMGSALRLRFIVGIPLD